MSALPRHSANPATGEDYLARARALGPLLEAAGDEIEARRELPPGVVAGLVGNGLFWMLLPASLGGGELHPLGFCAVIEEVARHDASTAWCLGQACGCTVSAAFLAPEIAREIFGPPRGIVAWGPPGAAQARTVPGGFRLSGSWSFASGSHHATWLGAHVAVFDAAGMPLQRPDGSAVIRTLLFPKSAATMTDTWHVVGLKGTGSDTYAVADLFVPEDHTILREHEPVPREPGVLYRFSSSNLYASGFASIALGIADSVLVSFIELARDKIPRGARVTMRNNNVVQSEVAQAEARLGGARAYLHQTIGESWHMIAERGRLTMEANATLRLATTWAIHQARDVVDVLYQAAGATAIFNTSPFERRLRDMHTVAQQMQGRQSHFETVGRIRMGLPPDATMFTF